MNKINAYIHTHVDTNVHTHIGMVIWHTYIYTYMCVYTWVKNCDDMNICMYKPALFQESFQWWGYGFRKLGDRCQKLEYILLRKSAFRSGEAPNSRLHEKTLEDVDRKNRRASVRVFVRVGDSCQAGARGCRAPTLKNRAVLQKHRGVLGKIREY
jgi:hypothetical protein